MWHSLLQSTNRHKLCTAKQRVVPLVLLGEEATDHSKNHQKNHSALIVRREIAIGEYFSADSSSWNASTTLFGGFLVCFVVLKSLNARPWVEPVLAGVFRWTDRVATLTIALPAFQPASYLALPVNLSSASTNTQVPRALRVALVVLDPRRQVWNQDRASTFWSTAIWYSSSSLLTWRSRGFSLVDV